MLSWWRSWLLLGVHLRGSWGLQLGGSVVLYLRYNRNGCSEALGRVLVPLWWPVGGSKWALTLTLTLTLATRCSVVACGASSRES